jgi:hypothetical protein
MPKIKRGSIISSRESGKRRLKKSKRMTKR